MPVAIPLVVGALAAGAVGGITSAMNASAAKKAAGSEIAASPTPNASQTVGDTANKTSQAQNLGRAALISTSPSGVLGSDPTGRRKLLGNS